MAIDPEVLAALDAVIAAGGAVAQGAYYVSSDEDGTHTLNAQMDATQGGRHVYIGYAAEIEDAAFLSASANLSRHAPAIKAMVEENERLRAFVVFALRHTLPARASARTHEETHSMLLHHPAAEPVRAALQEPTDGQ